MMLKELLNDPYEAIQIIAIKSFRNIPATAGISFDILNAGASLKEVTDIAIRQWQDRDSELNPDSAVLTNPDGTFSVDGLRQLLNQRDDRQILLAE